MRTMPPSNKGRHFLPDTDSREMLLTRHFTTFHVISRHFTTVGIWRNMKSPVAGARNPVTQWNTNDVRKSIFMPFFYQNWKKLKNGQKIL